MAKKKVLLLVVVLSLSGCGTINTVFRADVVTSKNLKGLRSHCEKVPRVYSGVAYDFCSLHGEPQSAGNWEDTSANSVPWVLFDFLVSGALDTLLLPYTLYRQSADGSIDI